MGCLGSEGSFKGVSSETYPPSQNSESRTTKASGANKISGWGRRASRGKRNGHLRRCPTSRSKKNWLRKVEGGRKDGDK